MQYRELIWKLISLAVATRSNISHAIGVLFRFVENPGPEHYIGVLQSAFCVT